MRKLIVTEFITLDGVVEDPGEKVKLELVEHAAYANGVTLQVLDVVHCRPLVRRQAQGPTLRRRARLTWADAGSWRVGPWLCLSSSGVPVSP